MTATNRARPDLPVRIFDNNTTLPTDNAQFIIVALPTAVPDSGRRWRRRPPLATHPPAPDAPPQANPGPLPHLALSPCPGPLPLTAPPPLLRSPSCLVLSASLLAPASRRSLSAVAASRWSKRSAFASCSSLACCSTLASSVSLCLSLFANRRQALRPKR